MLTLTTEGWQQELQNLWKYAVKVNEPMSRHTSFRIGGPARALLVVNTADDLRKAVAWARERQVAYYVIGHGSNILVVDAGLDGLVIVNRCNAYHVEEEGDSASVYAESGVSLHRLVYDVGQMGWSGLEWAAGIPGTLGGAIVGNAGAFGNNMSCSVIRVHVLDEWDQLQTLHGAALEFSYRSSRFKKEGSVANRKLIILSTELALRRGSREEIQRITQETAQSRRQKQPLDKPSAGSIFKNPTQDYAGRLIEATGLKGTRIGGAQVSQQHANFIVNTGNANANDVMELIELIREKVRHEFSQELDLEIECVGQYFQTTGSGKES